MDHWTETDPADLPRPMQPTCGFESCRWWHAGDREVFCQLNPVTPLWKIVIIVVGCAGFCILVAVVALLLVLRRHTMKDLAVWRLQRLKSRSGPQSYRILQLFQFPCSATDMGQCPDQGEQCKLHLLLVKAFDCMILPAEQQEASEGCYSSAL